MNPYTYHFRPLNSEKQVYCIAGLEQLTTNEALFIRECIQALKSSEHTIIYLDAKEVKNADLSGINEIIHSHYTLRQAEKRLVLVYRKSSSIEKWIAATRLDHFIDTAILPAS